MGALFLRGLEGFAIGLAAGAFGAAALWFLIQLIGTIARGGRSPALGTVLTLLAFAGKVPVYMVAWRIVQGVGDPAPGWFLAGVGLVYSCLVGWAMARP